MRSVLKEKDCPRIVVVGDSLLDVYFFGKSCEGETPRFSCETRVDVPGGAGNVASNIRTLGGYPLLFSRVGTDEASVRYMRKLKERRISTQYIQACTDGGVSVKIRYCEEIPVFHADCDFINDSTERDTRRIIQDIQRISSQCHAVIISDYAKGFCNGALYRKLNSYCRRKTIPLFVDSKSRYPPVFAYVYKPNRWEFEKRLGYRIRHKKELVAEAEIFQNKYQIQNIIVTMDKQGSFWIDPERIVRWYQPYTNAVVDSCGAGDTFLSTLAVATGKGIPMEKAVPLANKAAGIVCQHRGTYPVKAHEVFDGRIY